MAAIISPKIFKFCCECCGTKTNNKKDINNHYLTPKHIKKANPQQNAPSVTQNPQQNQCKICKKEYESRSGLWRHKKTCVAITEKANITLNTSEMNSGYIKDKDSVIDLLINENKDFKNIIMELVKNNGDLQKQMLEVCKKTNTTIFNNSQNNSHNKTFNLQFFLNEQCKDAMNLTDFVDTMTLEFSDLEDVGKLGYVEGISKIMIRKLNELDIYKRPIHCSDAKREIMYVKEHNVWEKEKNSNEHIRKAIKRVTHKNGGMLVPWSLENPNCMNLDHHLNDVYLRMMGQSMGGSGEFVDNENKIMKKIAKAVFIDKAC
jgi:hypothetical protein